MSKTDHTAPYWVQALDRPSDLVAHHDHSDGPCDLPPRPTRWRPDPDLGVPRGRCWWTTSIRFNVERGCGCWWCSGKARRRERRRERRRARALLRQQARTGAVTA